MNTKPVRRLRRVYTNPVAMASDVVRLLARSRQVARLMRGSSIEPAFRERLMLAVTAVNECRYCSYGHTRLALAVGVRAEEVQSLAGGTFDGCPADELPALLYAQHWAENDGETDPAARSHLASIYGTERLDAIELVLRVIRAANLGGNTLDRVLYLLSFGRIGIDLPLGAAPADTDRA